MNKYIKYISALLLAAATLSAECDHSTKRTNNYMIPVGRVVLNPDLGDCGVAISGLGEVGVRNYRGSLTAGFWSTERSRLKITGEYLTQKLSWNFSPGPEHKWVRQGAVAADWQFLMDDCSVFQAFDLKGYYSYAKRDDLHQQTCTLIGGGIDLINRHLSGAEAYGGSLNGLLTLSDCSLLDLSLNYDHLKYRHKYHSPKYVEGLGGSFVWLTRLPCCVDFALEAQFRRPFNYFGARITDRKFTGLANSVVSFFAGWTRGKYGLPNSIKVGVEFAYNFQLGDCCERTRDTCPVLWDPCDLNAWAVVPAIYQPEVLVISEQTRRVVSRPQPLPQ